MSTDDKPLLTEWQKSDYAEDVWVRYRQDAVCKWAGVTAARKTWTVWASRMGGLVSGGCETGGIVAMRAAADAAARQWYTLPSPAGQPAAPPEPYESPWNCDCPSLPCVHRPRGSELASTYMDEGARIVAARIVRAHPFAPGTTTGTRQAWLREAIACAIEGKQAPPFVEAVPPAASPPPVAAPAAPLPAPTGEK